MAQRPTDYALHADLLMPLLHTKMLGRSADFLQTIPSTNLLAKQKIRENCAHGAIILAETQTSGRGRLGRIWQNAPGQDICISIILRPKFETQHATRYTLATALGVYQSCLMFGLTPCIKWPNDILINGKKLCGILLELCTIPQQPNGVIIGIGLNVNTTSFPEELDKTATSFALALGHPAERVAVLAALLNTLEPLYDACETADGFARVLAEYARHCVTIGQFVHVTDSNGTMYGVAEGVDATGRLLLRTTGADAQSTLLALLAGEVTLSRALPPNTPARDVP